MKNKRVIIAALIMLFGRLGLLAQTAGVTGGAQWLWLYDDNYNKPVVWTYAFGFQQTVFDKVCLGVVFNTSLDAGLNGNNDLVLEAEPDVYIQYSNYVSNYKSLSFESRYFLNDFDDMPIGVYIGSSYKYAFYNSNNTIERISDKPDWGGTNLPNYYQLKSYDHYISPCSVHSFGLKIGLMTGALFNFYLGYDYNLPFVKEHLSILNSNLKLSPPVASTSFNIGVSIGFGIGY